VPSDNATSLAMSAIVARYFVGSWSKVVGSG